MIIVDSRWVGQHGIGRFARETIGRMNNYQDINCKAKPSNPIDPFCTSIELLIKKPNVYFSPGFNPPIYSACPFVFTIHDLNHLHDFGNNSALKTMYYEYIIKPACHKAYKVCTVSEFSKQEIVNWAGLSEEKVVNVGNAVSSNFNINCEPHRPGYDYILYVGNLKNHKNVKRMIDAFRWSKASSEIKLLISTKENKYFKELVANYNLQCRVIFYGNILEADLPSFYKGAMATILVSLYEGFGLPIIESMACGTPVITSNVSAMPEISGDAALLVDPYSVENISSTIDKIASDPKEREKLRSRGLEKIKCYSWDITAEKIRKIISQAEKNY